MRILLDECIPEELTSAFLPEEAISVRRAGLAGLSNGDLLSQASIHFDAFVTIDKGIYFQHRHGKYPIRILCVQASSNRIEELLPRIANVVTSLSIMSPGQVVLLPKRTPND